jgi:hypothetical protein
MADELPEPKSRKESYLAKAAGMDVTIPEKPESREEQYLNAIAEGGGGGGGGTYSAGDGIDITNDTISVDTDTIQEKLTAGTGIDITNNTISATGGGGPTVVQTTGTSTTDVMSQNAVSSMVFNDPDTNLDVRIGGGASVYHRSGRTYRQVAIGDRAKILSGGNNIAIGQAVTVEGTNDGSIAIGGPVRSERGICIGGNLAQNCTGAIVIGYAAAVGGVAGNYPTYSVALGYEAKPSRSGEVNVGSGTANFGYNSTRYRVIGGVHDGQDAHDATTVGQVNTRLGGLTLLPITQAAYDALATKDANTLYVITGA